MSATYLFTAEEAEAGRQRVLQEISALVSAEFARDATLQSAAMLVAQYWNDEANDAVHCAFLLSTEPTPTPTPDAAYCAPGESGRFEPSEGSRANMYVGLYQLMTRGPVREPRSGWNDNGEAISLFAAYTKEHCHQEMDYAEAYAPYALFTRSGPEAVTTRVVAEQLRPWLDGIRPSWDGDDDAPRREPVLARAILTDIADDLTVTVQAYHYDPPSGTRPLVLGMECDADTVEHLERFEAEARPVMMHYGVERHVGLLRTWPGGHWVETEGGRRARVLLTVRSRTDLRADFVRLQQALAPDHPLDQAALVRIDAELERLDQ